MEKDILEKTYPGLGVRTAPPPPKGSGGLMIWALPLFIVCGFMFALGVLVGRNTVPIQFDVDGLELALEKLQHKDEAERLEREKAEKERLIAEKRASHASILAQLKDQGDDEHVYQQFVPHTLSPKYPKKAPTREAAAAADKGLVLASARPSPGKAGEAPLPPTKTPAPATLSPIPAPLKPPAPVAASAPVPAPEPIAVVEPEETLPTPETPQSKTAGKFAIQVASLKNLEQAQKLMGKLKEKGYPAFFQSSTLNGQTWHRVRIGPYPDRSQAGNDQNRLKQAGIDSLILSAQ